jgi:hypothetical protein
MGPEEVEATLKEAGYKSGADKSRSTGSWPSVLGHHGDLRDDGVRADRGVPGGTVPTKIRYTSMSLPYHIGNGWFGGMLPLTATAMVAATGDIYYGLWYPIVVAMMTLIIGSIFLRETKDRDIRTYEHAAGD